MTDGVAGVRHVVVLGAEHSGTTILYQMLALHPGVTWFSQYSLREGTVPGRTRLPAANLWDRALRVVALRRWEKTAPRGIERLRPYPQEAAEIWRHLLPLDRSLRDGNEPARIASALETLSTATNRPVIVSKAPRLCWEIEPLAAAVPDTRFVHIVRDGRAAVASLIAKYRQDGREGATDAALEHWTDAVRTVNAAAERLPVLQLRYEEFCNDVPGDLARVLAFCGLSMDDFPFERVPRTLSSTNRGRVGELSEDERIDLEARLAPLLRELGYV